MSSISKLVNSIIKKNNICTVFGYSGGSIMPIIDTLYKDICFPIVPPGNNLYKMIHCKDELFNNGEAPS